MTVEAFRLFWHGCKWTGQWQDPWLVIWWTTQIEICVAQYVKAVRTVGGMSFISILTVCVSDIKLVRHAHPKRPRHRELQCGICTHTYRHALDPTLAGSIHTIGRWSTQTSSQNKCGGDSVERGSVVLRNFGRRGREQWYNTVNVADRYVLTST